MSASIRNRFGLLVIGAGLVVTATHHVVFAPVFTDSLVGLLASFLPPLLAGAAAVSLLVFVRVTESEQLPLWRGAIWYLAGAVLFGVAMYLSFANNIAELGLPPGAWFSMVNWSIGGSAIGLLMANYDLRRSRALRRARTHEHEAAALTRRLSVLNRVLRHDVRNKTNIIQGYAHQLETESNDAEAATAIAEAADSLTTIADRVRQIQHIVEEESPAPVDLTVCVTELVEELRESYPDADVTVEVDENLAARTYPAIRTVLAELFENAIEHNPQPESNCRLEVTVHESTSGAEESVGIEIEDNGPGIPVRERQAIVDTGTETQLTHSRGMNLWLTRWVVDESDGDFAIGTSDADGARLQLRLPAADE